MSSVMTSRAGIIIEVASSCTVNKSGISIVSSCRAGSIATASVFFFRCRSFSSNNSFSRSFFDSDLSSRSRERSPGRPPDDGAGVSVGLLGVNGRAAPGRWPGASGRNGPFPVGRRAPGAVLGATGGRGPGATGDLPPCPGNAWPGRGATPGRPGMPVRGPGDAEIDVVGGGAGRRGAIDVCPAGTGCNRGIGACSGFGAGRPGAGGGLGTVASTVGVTTSAGFADTASRTTGAFATGVAGVFGAGAFVVDRTVGPTGFKRGIGAAG